MLYEVQLDGQHVGFIWQGQGERAVLDGLRFRLILVTEAAGDHRWSVKTFRGSK